MMNLDRDRQSLLTILGVSAGVAAGVAGGLWLWRRIAGGAEAERWAEPMGSAQDVANALRSDSRLSGRRIDVDTIAEGVVELSGSVRDRAEADRAVGIAQQAIGVYTVVNRLRIEAEEAQRETTRRRRDDGAPEFRERQHYGMGVGMGTSRHSPTTDPDRPNDRPRMLERELEPDPLDEVAEDESDTEPGMETSEPGGADDGGEDRT
jgi:hypothetical protein